MRVRIKVRHKTNEIPLKVSGRIEVYCGTHLLQELTVQSAPDGDYLRTPKCLYFREDLRPGDVIFIRSEETIDTIDAAK